MSIDRTVRLADGATVRARFTERADGDLRSSLDAALLGPRRRVVAPLPWAWVRQVHGADVVVVDDPSAPPTGRDADALVTRSPRIALAVHTADCGPVLLVDPTAGVLAVAHAGWRGVASGILDRTLDTMEVLGACAPVAVLGPCIHAECYEFDGPELDELASALGPQVIGRTRTGSRALDLPSAIRVALGRRGVPCEVVDACTACDPTRWYSHRARAEAERHALVAWIEVP